MLRRKIGRYYLTQHLGSGGMADVYLALDPKTRERRAVKILARRATAAPAAYARFLREVEIIAALSHPRIVKILDSGALEDCYYYFMEYMPGGNLAKKIARGRIPPAEALALFTGICDGMTYAHQRGVVHRDLKPANILLDASGQPSVADFGIAKSLAEEGTALTKSNEVMGTIAYLAPEQRCSTKRVDRRADVYSLGALLYEMFMGFPPLGNFPWPGETRAGLPGRLRNLLEKCLALEPHARFADAGSLLSEARRLHTDAGERADARTQCPNREEDWTPSSDRIEGWLELLRTGTTRERLAVVREMVNEMQPAEANAVLKLYTGEEDRVRWGLIRVFGELKIVSAVSMIVGELQSPYHRECAVEALGRIGAPEAFGPILDFIAHNPDAAAMALSALASTGKGRAVPHLRPYLSHPLAVVRQTATKALSAIPSIDVLDLLRNRFSRERDEKVRAALAHAVHTLEIACAQDQDTIVLTGGSTRT